LQVLDGNSIALCSMDVRTQEIVQNEKMDIHIAHVFSRWHHLRGIRDPQAPGDFR